MKLHNATAVPTTMYGSETWMVKRNHEPGMQTAEMKFLQVSADHALSSSAP
jgi:hypothetical protein